MHNQFDFPKSFNRNRLRFKRKIQFYLQTRSNGFPLRLTVVSVCSEHKRASECEQILLNRITHVNNIWMDLMAIESAEKWSEFHLAQGWVTLYVELMKIRRWNNNNNWHLGRLPAKRKTVDYQRSSEELRCEFAYIAECVLAEEPIDNNIIRENCTCQN